MIKKLINNIRIWWALQVEEWRNYSECSRIEAGWDCKNRKCLGKRLH